MRRVGWVSLVAIALASPAVAQEEPRPEQLKKMYDDALQQLKAVQDRRNELSRENESLAAKVKELEASLQSTRAEADALRRDAGEYAERTFNLRAHRAAWLNFLQMYPDLMTRWKIYLGSGVAVSNVASDGAGQWPIAD